MKHLRLITLALFGMLISLNSFAQIDEEDLHQRWQAVSVDDSRFDESDKALSADLISEKEALDLAVGLLSLEFLKNGTVIFHSYPESDVATYSFSKKNNRLRIFEQIGRKADVFTISKLDKDELVLIQQNKIYTVTLTFRTYDPILDQNKALDAYNKLIEAHDVDGQIKKVKESMDLEPPPPIKD